MQYYDESRKVLTGADAEEKKQSAEAAISTAAGQPLGTVSSTSVQQPSTAVKV